jgi:proprotein convertase subtilisin/kexin type 5
MWWKGSCLLACPEGTYPDERVCRPCETPCGKCLSLTKCLTCRSGFFKINGTTDCVDKDNCTIGTFPNEETQSCDPCYFTCYSCSGATSKECIICNFARGFARGSGDKGDCYALICTDGAYLAIDSLARTASCQACHSNCRTCDGAGFENCSSCSTGLIATKSPFGSMRTSCLECGTVFPGTRPVQEAETTCRGLTRFPSV